MSGTEEKGSTRTVVGVIVVIISIAFTGMRYMIKMQRTSDRSATNARIEREIQERQVRDSIQEATGTRVYEPGNVFVPKDKSFFIPVMVRLTSVTSLFKDEEELLFVGVPNTTSNDKARLSVARIPIDNSISLIENWNRYEKQRAENQKAGEMQWAPLTETFPETDTTMSIHSKNNELEGILQLKRKGDFLYILKAQSLSKDWTEYRGKFLFSFNLFAFTDNGM